MSQFWLVNMLKFEWTHFGTLDPIAYLIIHEKQFGQIFFGDLINLIDNLLTFQNIKTVKELLILFEKYQFPILISVNCTIFWLIDYCGKKFP